MEIGDFRKREKKIFWKKDYNYIGTAPPAAHGIISPGRTDVALGFGHGQYCFEG